MPAKGEVNGGAGALPADGQTNSLGMSNDDVCFLVDCLSNTTSGTTISIDCKAVAEARNYKNPGSVSNRLAKMKKKYNLPIGTGNGANRKASDAMETVIPTTPNKNKVTKATSTRGRAVPKKVVKNIAREESVSDGEEDAKSSSDEKDTKLVVVSDEESVGDDKEEFLDVQSGLAEENVESA